MRRRGRLERADDGGLDRQLHLAALELAVAQLPDDLEPDRIRQRLKHGQAVDPVEARARERRCVEGHAGCSFV